VCWLGKIFNVCVCATFHFAGSVSFIHLTPYTSF